MNLVLSTNRPSNAPTIAVIAPSLVSQTIAQPRTAPEAAEAEDRVPEAAVDKLHRWLVEHRELKKARSYHAAMRIIGGLKLLAPTAPSSTLPMQRVPSAAELIRSGAVHTGVASPVVEGRECCLQRTVHPTPQDASVLEGYEFSLIISCVLKIRLIHLLNCLHKSAQSPVYQYKLGNHQVEVSKQVGLQS